MNNLKTFEQFKFIDDIRYRNIPEKYREVYKSIKDIFTGDVFIKYIIREHRDVLNGKLIVKNLDTILVGGKKDDGCDIYMKMKSYVKPRRFSGSARFEFNLTDNFDNIIEWIKGYQPIIKITKDDPYGEEDWNPNREKPKKSQMQDFLDNFDEYQGEGSIGPTKDKPYEFWDND